VFVNILFYLALKVHISKIKNRGRDLIIREMLFKVIGMLFLLVCYSEQSLAQAVATEQSPDTIELKTSSLKTGEDGLTTKVIYSADDSVRLMVNERKVYLYGNAKVTYEDMKLEAQFIEVDFETNDIHATGLLDSTGTLIGKPIFTTEGSPYNAEEMWYNFKTKKGTSIAVVTEFDEGIVRGEKFVKDSMDHMYVRRASYTTCNAEHPHFWIAASKFKVIPEKQAISGPANLVIAGVNTPLILPFGFFPIQQKRSKGILIGKFGEQDNLGFYLRDFGYYAPINDYLDFKLTGDFYFRGSWGLGFQSNYKKLYKYEGGFSIRYNKFLIGEKESPTFTTNNEYRIDWRFRRDAKAKPGRSFSANVNYVTKDQQKFTSSNVDDIVATNANSNVSYSRSFFKKKLNFTANGRISQNLSNGDMNIDLPDLNFSLNRLQPFKSFGGSSNKWMVLKNFGFSYVGSMRNSISVNQDSIFEGGQGVVRLSEKFKSQVKNGIKQTVNMGTSFKVLKYFTFSPSMNYNELWYAKTLQKTWTGDTLIEDQVSGFSRVGSYSSSLSFATTVYGYKGFAKGKISGIRHIIRPTISGAYTPNYVDNEDVGYRNVQMDTAGNFGWYSIYDRAMFGGPSGRENASLNFSIGNNLEMKVRTTDTANGGLKKIKLIDNLSIAGGYNFLADSLNLSSIRFSAFTTLFELFRINLSGGLDPYNFSLDTNGNGFKIDRLMILDRKLGRITNALLSISTSLKPESFKRSAEKEEGQQSYMRYFTDFKVPWDVNLSYSFTYRKQFDQDPRKDQTIKYSGNLKLTDNWRIGFTSGYNFIAKKSAITSLDFARDLHCWEFNFRWVPVGVYKQFNFELRVKSSTLKDLKIRRQETWFDAVN
jgi:LptD protein